MEANPYDIELDETNDNTEYYAKSSAAQPARKDTSMGSINYKGMYSTRLLICGLGLGLLWTFSLKVAADFVDAIIDSPTDAEVQAAWKVTADNVLLQRSRSKSCVAFEVDQCQSVLVRTFENFNSQETEQANQFLVQNATVKEGVCSFLKAKKLKVMQKFKIELQEEGKSIEYHTDKCTALQIKNLEELYTDPALSANQATSSMTQYGNERETIYSVMLRNMEARRIYDEEYWANKTAQYKEYMESLGVYGVIELPSYTDVFPPTDFNIDTSLDEYYACATLSNECSEADSLRAKANATLDAFYAEYGKMVKKAQENQEEIKQQIADFKAKLAEYEAWRANAEAVYKGLEAALTAASTVGVNITLPSAGFEINPGDFSVPSFDPEFPNIDIDARMADIDVSATTKAINTRLIKIRDDMSEKANDIRKGIVDNISEAFDLEGWTLEYEPPEVVVPYDEVTNLTNQFKEETKQSLKNATAGIDFSAKVDEARNMSNSVLRFLEEKFVTSSAPFNFKSPEGEVDFEFIFLSFSSFSFMFFLLDYAWIIFRSSRIVLKYWSGASGEMPPVDIRAYRTTKKTPITVKYVRLVTSPWALIGYALGLGLAATIIIYGIYIPMLNDYMNGCVNSQNGTLFTTNANAAAFNAAAFEGNRDLANEVEKYDVERASLCGSTMQEASNAYASRQQQLALVAANFASTYNLLLEMETCTTGLDDVARLTGEPFDNLINLIDSADCSAADFEALGALKTPKVNCSLLPSCEPSCTLDKALLYGNTHGAGCITEWWLHTSILKTVATVIVWIFWNVSRSMLLTGICRLLWRSLTPNGFAFLGSCSREGEIADDTEEQLAAAIASSTKAFQAQGWVFIAGAALMQIPYIVVCVLLNLNLRYPYTEAVTSQA